MNCVTFKSPVFCFFFFFSSNRFRVTSLNHAGISFLIHRTSPPIEIDFYSTLADASSFDSLLAALNLACKMVARTNCPAFWVILICVPNFFFTYFSTKPV